MTYFKYLIFIVICFSSLAAESKSSYEDVYYKLDQALNIVFPSKTHVTKKDIKISAEKKILIEKKIGIKLSQDNITIYEGFLEDSSLGYALVLDEQGKYQPITIMTCIDRSFSVSNIVLMVYREKIGSEVRKRRFIKQFINKSSKDKLQVNNDISAVSGATISSYSMASAVKKSIAITEELFKNS
jgi:thiamine biosynthesis lipoprotein